MSVSETMTEAKPPAVMADLRIIAPAAMTSTRPGCMKGSAARSDRVMAIRVSVTACTAPAVTTEPWSTLAGVATIVVGVSVLTALHG